jgi:Cdc6-like AAA superfamily ATPase
VLASCRRVDRFFGVRSAVRHGYRQDAMSPRLKRGEPEQLQRVEALTQAFRPAAPIDRRALFSGRTAQIGDLFGVVDQPGQHAVVYGERGVGKTSLVTVAAEMLAAGDVLVARTICDRSDDFGSVWWKALDEIQMTVTRPGVGFTGRPRELPGPASALLGGDATPYAVKRSLQTMTGERRVAIFVDEFDRLASSDARLLFADTIKMLSDQLVGATVVLVGVADDIDQLIAEHQSIERALVQIHMPRMSPGELAEIVTGGMARARMTIDADAVETIARLAQGLPHYAHLLGQLSARIALDGPRTRVQLRDVREAVSEAIEKAQQSILDAYRRAAVGNRATLYPQVVLACALASSDEYGFFAPGDVRVPLGAIAGKEYDTRAFARHLDELAGPGHGSMLQKRSESGGTRYRFVNPLLQPYVLMRGLAEGAVGPELLRAG